MDPVATLIASLSGLDVTAVVPSARLSSDLNLDSLQRVELLGLIEEDLGVFIDDDALEPDATVADVITMVEAARDSKRSPSRGPGRFDRPSARSASPSR